MSLLGIIFFVIAIYLVSGFLFSILFIIKWVGQMDESAKEAGWGFRIIIIPGCIVFWPFLLSRWLQNKKQGLDGSNTSK